MMSRGRHDPEAPYWDGSTGGKASLRRVASRRRLSRARWRRVVPSVIVGSTTLLGTGGLVSWVAARPGLSSSTVAAAVAPTTVAPRSDDAALGELQARTIRAVDRQLAAEVTQLKRLDKALASFGAREAAARAAAARAAVQSGSTGGASQGAGSTSPGSGMTPSSPSSGSSSGSSSLTPIQMPSVAPIAIPVAPAALPAPPVAAATGGSHPVP